LIRQAGRGTLYLSGVAASRAKLGRALARIVQHGTFRPLGGRRDEEADIRLILAARAAHAGLPITSSVPQALRPSLAQLQLVVPPLRERPEDIPAIIDQSIREFREGTDDPDPVSFAPDALELLQRQTWPGNVRQLQHVIRWAILCRRRSTIDDSLVRKALAALESSDRPGLPLLPGKVRSLREWEEEAIRQALRATGGKKTAASRLLGIHRNTLILKLKRMKGA